MIVEAPSHPAAGVSDAFSLEGDYPLAWAHAFGSGRAYYNAVGHFPATWRDSRFQAQLVAAIRWTGSR